MAKKSFNEKLRETTDLPQVKFVGYDEKMSKRFGSGNMLIASPIQYDEVMKKIPKSKLTTTDTIRAFLAKQHGADFTCQLTAGIFINIVAKASAERESEGLGDITPYWRTLKKDGELNEKYPGGIDQQKLFLELEGFEIIKKGKRYFVKDFQNHLFDL